MLEFVGVNEHGTNLPLEVYDPSDFPMDADYEAIAHTQRAKWEESNKPRPTTVASQPRNFAVSKKHQLMLERFHSRDPKK
ncbi:hypothetical protein PSACC_00975 [Paramicrosporidium saccamoebae]|uniref:Uncharacterized protein n=1 Tax=Paramicrosporidium saccamoebae TaxID=1246581 RepID=A0A2H9TN61_9FUNG|nr:hypothetical protein PSACC_00975 [Paramicrosporidium saccamoebae]